MNLPTPINAANLPPITLPPGGRTLANVPSRCATCSAYNPTPTKAADPTSLHARQSGFVLDSVCVDAWDSSAEDMVAAAVSGKGVAVGIVGKAGSEFSRAVDAVA